MKTAIYTKFKNPWCRSFKGAHFCACVRRSDVVTVIRSHGPLSALTQGLSLKIYLCFTECLRCNSWYTHQYQFERRYGTEGKPQKCWVALLCVSTLGWQTTFSASVSGYYDWDTTWLCICSKMHYFLGWKGRERRFWNTLQMQHAGK